MKNVLLIIASCCSLLFYNGLNCCFSKEQDNVLVCKPTDGYMICYIGSHKSEYQKSEPRRNYLTIKEYENKDYINIRNVHLPEYELRDSSMADLISRFIEAEKHQQYYDKDGYILLCKETPTIWTLMSIFPNMYSFSDYGSYDGVMHFCGHTFILSLGDHIPYPFIRTGKSESIKFLEAKEGQKYFMATNMFFNVWDYPDPMEVGYPIWLVMYDSIHRKFMMKPDGNNRFPSSEVLPKIDFDLNPKAESDVMINVL